MLFPINHFFTFQKLKNRKKIFKKTQLQFKNYNNAY